MDPWHFLNLRSLSSEDWRDLLALAERLTGPAGRLPLLAGRRFGMLFFNPSLRTRTSFEVASFDLGAHAVYLQVGGGLWNLETEYGVTMDGDAAEHVAEAIPVLGTMTDAIGVRSFARMVDADEDAKDPVLGAIAEISPVPILSLESAVGHPHQGLADALTVRQVCGGEKVKIALSFAPHIKPLPQAVANAALMAFAREGHEIVLAHPEGYDLHEGVMEDAQEQAGLMGGSIRVSHDQHEAVAGARVVYAKSWGAPCHYGDEPASKASLAAHRDWMIDDRLLLDTDMAHVMHCLPVRRGVVIHEDVLDGQPSIVVPQGGARLPVQKATLCRAMGVGVEELDALAERAEATS